MSDVIEKTAQQLHDEETFAFNAWKNNPNTSSYTWAIEVAGEIALREYDPCECDDKGEPDPTGHMRKIAEWPAPPFVLIAEPKTLDHQNLPELRVPIAAGEKPVWEHRVRQLLAPDGRSKFEDVQLIGVERADGTVAITTSYPDGSTFDHSSHEEALAHAHPFLALIDRPDIAPGEAPIRR